MLKYCVIAMSLLGHSVLVVANNDPAPALTEDTLRPMCSNEQVWSSHGVSTERCMDVATECAKRNEAGNMTITDSLQSLYDCIFDELNIQMHHR